MFASIAYTLGWRKEELLDLKRHRYDTDRGTLTAGTRQSRRTKAPRTGRSPASLRRLSSTGRSRACQRPVAEAGRLSSPGLFPISTRIRSRRQHQVDPRPSMGERACRLANMLGLLIHDLRRSAVRNMEQAGVPRSIAMKITGHRDRGDLQEVRGVQRGRHGPGCRAARDPRRELPPQSLAVVALAGNGPAGVLNWLFCD